MAVKGLGWGLGGWGLRRRLGERRARASARCWAALALGDRAFTTWRARQRTRHRRAAAARVGAHGTRRRSCELGCQHSGRLRHQNDRLLWSHRCWCRGQGVEVERALRGRGRSTCTRYFGSAGGRGRSGLGPRGQSWRLWGVEVDDSWWSVRVLGPFLCRSEHRRLKAEIQKAAEQSTAVRSLQRALSGIELAQLANSVEAVVVYPQDQQLGGACHCLRGQCHVDGHVAALELRRIDGDIVGAPREPRAVLSGHLPALS